MENQDLMIRIGKSKMDKLKEQFVQTDKETGYLITQRVGPQGFLLWWYLSGFCYGDKIHAYPKKETMIFDLFGSCELENKKEREKWLASKKDTLRRWMKLLEDEKILKTNSCIQPKW